MTDLALFFDQLWVARLVLLKGLGLTVSISLLSIAIGSALGMLVGLSLT
jgi:polar amino acid transport system permease protein